MKRQYVNTNVLHKLRWLIKVMLLLVIIGYYSGSKGVYAQNSKLNFSFENTVLKEVLKAIKTRTDYDFVYNTKEVDVEQKVNLEVKNADIEEVLQACLKGLNIDFVRNGNVIILRKKILDKQPTLKVTISGKVIDNRKEPLPGVTISVLGTTLGVVSGYDGTFSLTVPDTEGVELLFSFIGMKSQTHKVKGNEVLQIIMEEEIAALDEVVVTGMEVIKKERMTGSASVVTAKDLKAQGITSIDQILEGMIAGLNSTSISGAPGSRAKITIRGENNLSGRTEPLWIVDGLPMLSGVPENNTGDYAGTIMQDGVGNIMPEDIESISILKDASAAAIYGAKAANGVIVITTKRGFRSKMQFNYSGTYSASIAPSMKMDFMNSEEKLWYEKAVMDNFGLDYAMVTGRGGYLYKQLYQGYITPEAYNTEIQRLKGTNTDWFKTIFRTAQSHSHNISLRGGTEQMTYYTSANFQEKSGILRSNKYSNAGILMKLDYRPVKNLILALDVSANVRKNRDHASVVDPFKYAVFANPYERPYDENGNYAADMSYLANNTTEMTASGYKYDNFNILREITENKLSQDGMDASLTFNARYEVIKGLTLESIVRKGVSYNTETTEIAPDTYTSYSKETFSQQAFKKPEVLPSEYNNGELSERSGKSFDWSIRNQIDYSFDIKDEHLFTVLVANEITSRKFNNFGYTSPIYYPDYRITGVPSYENGVTYKDMKGVIENMFSTSDGQDRTVSFLGAFRYGYKDRYIVNVNFRADGADAIGETQRFTPLWSVGLRYNLHREKFFENNIINELAIRGSYGYTGNIDRTAYPFSTLSLGSNLYEGNRYAEDFTYPNPAVKWEKKLDRNIGLDLSLLKSRISITADYYFNRTEDVLENLTLPISTGRSQVKANGGIVENKGVELYMNFRVVNRRDFSFTASFNISRNKNVIKKSYHTISSFADLTSQAGGVTNIIGEETGAIYGWQAAGVDPVSGNPRYMLTQEGKRAYAAFLDTWDSFNDAYKEEYSVLGGIRDLDAVPEYANYFTLKSGMQPEFVKASMQYLGRSNPKFVGGFNTAMRYKNIEFSTQWTFKTGHLIPSFVDYQNAPNNAGNAASGYSSDLSVSGTNRLRKYLTFWQAAGDRTDVHRFVSQGNDNWARMCTSDKYEKGNYLRMTNLSLSYRIPSDVIKKWGMNTMSLAFNARNLLTFTKYSGLDVGSGSAFSYPVSREFNIKLTVGF